MAVVQKLFRRAVVASAATALALVALPTAGHAFSGEPVTLTGEASCDTATGHQVVTWTLTNPSGTSVTIDSAAVDASLLTAGSEIDASATFTPTTVSDGGTATAATAATGDAQGPVELTVTYTFENLDPEVSASVGLPGGCGKLVVDTTGVATTTTTAAAGAAAQIRPTFTG